MLSLLYQSTRCSSGENPKIKNDTAALADTSAQVLQRGNLQDVCLYTLNK